MASASGPCVIGLARSAPGAVAFDVAEVASAISASGTGAVGAGGGALRGEVEGKAKAFPETMAPFARARLRGRVSAADWNWTV
jgi:hypothetical protein